MNMDNRKLKIDPSKVEYDGRSFRLIIENESSFLEHLKKKQAEMIKDLENSEGEQAEVDTNEKANYN